MGKKNKALDPKKSILILGSCITGIILIPTTILLFFAMLPTIVAGFIDRSGRGVKAMTVGAMNLAGTAPFAMDLWVKDHSMSHAFEIVTNPRTIIVIYCCAAIGYLIEWGVTNIVSSIMSQNAQGRLKDIRKQQEELARRWGREVTGEVQLDPNGFPVEAHEAKPARK